MPYKTVFLDRDGPLVIDKKYMGDPALIEFAPDAVAGCKLLRENGFKLVIISGQSGVARGKFSLEDMWAVHARVIEIFKAAGVEFDGAYYCPHGPEDGCACRKPKPGMVEQAVRELDLDPAQSVALGDKPSDLELGRNSGCRYSILVGEKEGEPLTPEQEHLADHKCQTLLQAAEWIVAHAK